MISMFLAVIIQGIVTVIILKQKERNHFFLLYAYTVVICMDFAFELFLYYYFKGEVFYLDAMPGSFRLLKGPLIFLFTRHIVGKTLKKNWIYILFVPFCILFLFNLILVISLLLDRSSYSNLLPVYSFFFTGYFYYWLGFLLISLIQFLQYANTKTSFYRDYLFFLSYLISGLVLYFVLSKMEVRMELFRNIYTYMFLLQFGFLIRLQQKYNGMTSVSTNRKLKYQNSVLKAEDIKRISTLITEFLEKNEDYTLDDFSLEYLANELEVPKHHISQAVTEGLKTTFYELVNTYRLELFLERLHQDHEVNIVDLSYQVGFKSRTTFYKYFKSKHGLTPSAYLYQLKNNVV